MNKLKLARAAAVMTQNIRYDAVLIIDQDAQIGDNVHGEIYFDKANRFIDGTRVVTSSVKRILGGPCEESPHDEDTISPYFIETRNTTYLVVCV